MLIQTVIPLAVWLQAKLPGCDPSVRPEDRGSRAADPGIGGGDNGEEKLWSPGNIHAVR